MDLPEQRERFDSMPVAKLLGMKFDHAEPGYTRLRMSVRENHMNNGQTVHGGIMATLAEAAAAQALATMLEDGEAFTTVELKINYLAPGLIGQDLIAEGRILHKGGRVAVGDMGVKEATSGRLVATGLHTFLILRSSKA